MVQRSTSRRSPAAILVVLLALASVLALASAGPARAAMKVVVQDREDLNVYEPRGGDGLDLLAHRYESLTDTTGRLTITTNNPRRTWRTATVFDLDRDGIADAEVVILPRYGTSDAEATVSLYVLPESRTYTDTSGNRCVATDPAGLTAAQTQNVSVGLSGYLSVNATLTWPAALADLALYAPRITTAALLPSLVTSNDELPSAAGSPTTDFSETHCAGGTALILDPAKGSDRGVPSGAVVRQALPDPDDAGADLHGVTAEARPATGYTNDVTNNPNFTQPETYHPTDLVLELPPTEEVSGSGWFSTGRTYSQGQTTPVGMFTFTRLAGADTARVELWRSPPWSGAFQQRARNCYPNAVPALAAYDHLAFDLPLTTASDGDRVLRLVADSLIDQQVHVSGTDKPAFRWVVSAFAPAERDVVPDTAGQRTYGGPSLGAEPCDAADAGPATDDGTSLLPDRFALFKDSPVLGATLGVSNDKPAKGESVALTVSVPSQTYSFDVADGRLAAQVPWNTETASFNASYTARAAVFDAEGVVQILERRISVANRPPVARMTANGAAVAEEYGLGADGTTIVFSGTGSDDPDGTPIASYAWTLTPSGGGAPVTGTGPSFSHTFAKAGSWTVKLRVTDPDGEAHETTAAFRISAAAPPPPPAPTKSPLVVLAGPASVDLGADGVATATFDATGSTGQNEDKALTYQWDLDGDGRYETDTGAEPKATARYTTRGARTVTVLGIDRYGNTATAAREVVVRSATDDQCGAGAIVRTVRYGPVRASGCLARIERPTAGPLWIASGRLNLNGLIITGARGSTAVARTFADCDAAACRSAMAAFNDPRKGTALALDPYDGKLASNAPVALTAEGTEVNLPLSLAPLDVTLPLSPRDDGFIVRVPPEAALFGFPLIGEAEVRFPAEGETSVRVTANGAGLLDGVSGDVQLRSLASRGIVLDRLRLGFDEGLLRRILRVKRLELEYDRAEQLWAGSAVVLIPAGRPLELGAGAAVQGGRFKSLHGSVFGINQHLGKGIFLQGIRFGVAVDPLDLSGGISLSAGPAIRIKGEPRTLLRADGDFRLTFPSPQAPYTLFTLTASLRILDDFQVANAMIRFADNGFTEARFALGGEYGIGYFDASIGGWFTATKFNASGDAEVGLLVAGRKVGLLGAHAVVSTKGVAACGEIPVINLGGGLGYRWGEDLASFDGCDLSPYTEARPADAPAAMARAAAARRAPMVTVRPGAPSLALRVTGRGGAPDVRVVDAAGRTVFTTGGDELTEQRLVLHDAAHRTTTVLWKAPPAGRYAVVAADGSPALASVDHAAGRAAPKVRASVRSEGRRRVLRWTVTPALAGDQRLVLSESGAGGERELLETARSSGTLRFTPPPGGRRTVRAMVTAQGLGREPAVVARYTAPRLVLPGRPRAVALTRPRRGVRVAFRAPATGGPAASYRVTLRAGGRTLARVLSRPRAVTFTGVPAAQAARAEVRALAPGGLTGGVARATLRAGAARSGAARRDDVRPRALRVRRTGGALTATWKPGPELARGYRVRVAIGRRTYNLTASAARPRVRIAKAPRGRVRVTVTPLRLGGGTGPAAVARVIS